MRITMRSTIQSPILHATLSSPYPYHHVDYPPRNTSHPPTLLHIHSHSQFHTLLPRSTDCTTVIEMAVVAGVDKLILHCSIPSILAANAIAIVAANEQTLDRTTALPHSSSSTHSVPDSLVVPSLLPSHPQSQLHILIH